MILPDINLLLYAHHKRAPQHEKAKHGWNQGLAEKNGFALAWVVILGFMRISTPPKLFENPIEPGEALGRLNEWLTLPHVHILHPSANHFALWSKLMGELGTAGNLTSDAHLAALAIECGLVLHTTDADFARFPGLKWVNPLRSKTLA